MMLFILFNNKRFIFKKISLTDLGFLVIGTSVLISLGRIILQTGVLPLGGTYLTFLLMVLVYFCLSSIEKPQIYFKNISKSLLVTFGGISVFIFYKAIQKDFNYAALTSEFSYSEALGNISQLSMYCSFYLIGIFYSQKNNWLLAAVALIGGGLALVLQSKLLILVIGLLLLAKFLYGYDYKTNIISFSSLVFGTLLLLCLAPPAALNGRIDLFKISWSNYDYKNFFGVGLGHFNSFINNLFKNGAAENTVGQIDHLAFNDFTQVFIELGYPGIIGLVLIFVGLVNKRNLFYLGATGTVLIFMFPLQYLESVVLFSFTVFLLNTKQEKYFFKVHFSSLQIKSVLITISCLLFIYTSYEMVVFKKWSDTDRLLELNQNAKTNLRHYKDLEAVLCNHDEYHLKFGLHLMKDKNYNEALKAFNAAKKINSSYESYIFSGDCYFDMGHYREAISYYKTAELLRPKHLYPIYKNIYSLNNSGRKKEAHKYWKTMKDNFKKLHSPRMAIMKNEIEELLRY